MHIELLYDNIVQSTDLITDDAIQFQQLVRDFSCRQQYALPVFVIRRYL